MFKLFNNSLRFLRLDKSVDFKFINSIHCSPKTSVKLRRDVDNYLLNRSIPPSELLNSLTEEDAKELDYIKQDYEFQLSHGCMVPKRLQDGDYVELLRLTKGQRKKYYHFLLKKEYTKEFKENVKEEKRLARLESFHKIRQADGAEAVGKSLNRFFGKFQNTFLDKLNNQKLVHSIVLKSQELVFDMSFEDHMSMRELKNLCRQMQYSYCINKALDDPFHFTLVNVNPKSCMNQELKKSFFGPEVPTREVSELPLTMTHRHYLDVFADRRIIYLTNDSKNYFRPGEYDHDAVYIIGGVVNISDQKPLTLSRARKERLEHRAFPIDQYVHYSGYQGLHLDRVVGILSVARETNGDWEKAIRQNVSSKFYTDPNSKFMANNSSVFFSLKERETRLYNAYLKN